MNANDGNVVPAQLQDRAPPAGEPSVHHQGSFRSYMGHKISKLGEQFQLLQQQQQRSALFAGVSIYVNGYTSPSQQVRARHTRRAVCQSTLACCRGQPC